MGGNEQGFPRYLTWLEAHNATVANEEAEADLEGRTRSRLEALAGKAEEGTIDGDLLHEEESLDDYDEESINDPLSLSAKESYADERELYMESEDETDEDEDEGGDEEDEDSHTEMSEDDSEESENENDSDDDECSEEEFDQQAYIQQLEDDAFEREFRRVQMEALERGKSVARGAGGKVADSMPSGSQFIKKKPADPAKAAGASSGQIMALGGKEGISFQLLKKGNRGKVEAKELIVPSDTNLAKVATKQDDAAARERDVIKARVLQYSEEASYTGGNVYLEPEKLQVIRNRPLSMEEIDRNFGTTGGNLRSTSDKPRPQPPAGGGRGGRGRGRGSSGGRSLWG